MSGPLYQPPVWSPISLGAIAAGLTATDRHLRALRAQLMTDLGARDVVLTASGTVALALGMRAVARRSEPRIALPAYGCYDLATAADAATATVVLYDVDPKTLSPEPASFAAALESDVDAVALVHLYGIPVDPKFAALAQAHGVAILDDAAQGVGGSVRGARLGTQGDYGILSFGRGKGRGGGGGGALLVTSEWGVACGGWSGRDLPAAGRGAGKMLVTLAAQWALGRPGLYRLPASIPWLGLGETPYHPPPLLATMSPVAAAVVLSAAEAVERENEVRRVSGARWLDDLRGVRDLALIEPVDGAEPGWLRFPILASDALVPVLRSSSAKRLGVMPGYPTALDDLEGFASRLAGKDSHSGAQELAVRLFTLPTHGRFGADARRELLSLLRA